MAGVQATHAQMLQENSYLLDLCARLQEVITNLEDRNTRMAELLDYVFEDEEEEEEPSDADDLGNDVKDVEGVERVADTETESGGSDPSLRGDKEGVADKATQTEDVSELADDSELRVADDAAEPIAEDLRSLGVPLDYAGRAAVRERVMYEYAEEGNGDSDSNSASSVEAHRRDSRASSSWPPLKRLRKMGD